MAALSGISYKQAFRRIQNPPGRSMAKIEEIFLAGAAACQADPPLGLPIAGVVRREGPATARLAPLEVTAVAFGLGTTRVILCGVDTLGIQAPEVDDLR